MVQPRRMSLKRRGAVWPPPRFSVSQDTNLSVQLLASIISVQQIKQKGGRNPQPRLLNIRGAHRKWRAPQGSAPRPHHSSETLHTAAGEAGRNPQRCSGVCFLPVTISFVFWGFFCFFFEPLEKQLVPFGLDQRGRRESKFLDPSFPVRL